MTHAEPLDIVTLDFETFYAQDYTLTTMTTAEYVLDDRFQVIGMALAVNGAEPEWHAGHDACAAALARIDWSRAAALSHNCMPGDTEVLTRRGWQRLDDLDDNTEVAGFDPTTTEVAFTVPAAVVRRPYTGDLLVWDAQFHQGAYTPDHRMLVSSLGAPQWQFMPASEVATRSVNNTYLPTSGVSREATLSFTPDEARLLEACLADGGVEDRHIHFNLKKPRKKARLRELCSRLGVPLAERDYPDGRTVMRITNCPLRESLIRLLRRDGWKRVPWEFLSAPLEARQALLDETQHWDGVHIARHISTATADAERRDWLQAVAAITGTASRSHSIHNNRGYGAGRTDRVLHSVSIRDRRRVKLMHPPTTIAHDGMVYCLTMPTGAFLVRRNGVVWATGNCNFDMSILAWRFGIIPAFYLDTMAMARATLHSTIGRSSLDAVAKYLKLGVKGDAVVNMRGYRLEHMSPAALRSYGEYCVHDTKLCRAIWETISRKFPESELDVIDMLVRMFVAPQAMLDRERLERHLIAEQARTAALFATVAHVDKAVFSSSIKFAELLTSMGVDVPTKESPSTPGRIIPAMARGDREFKDMLDDDTLPADVQALLLARVGATSTIEATRTARLLRIASLKWSDDDTPGALAPLPVPLRYSGAHTHRFSGSDRVNLQNLKRDSDIRHAIVAPDGYSIVTRDASQIEARILATLAGQTDLILAFSRGDDVYSQFASALYQREITKANKLERFVGKTSILSLGYGAGAKRFRHALHIGSGGVSHRVSEDEADKIVKTYRARYPAIPALWRLASGVLDQMIVHTGAARPPANYDGGVRDMLACCRIDGTTLWLPSGLPLHYHNLEITLVSNSTTNQTSGNDVLFGPPTRRRRIYGGAMVENLCQALARIIVTDIMRNVRFRHGVVPLLQVHDSLVYCVATEQAEAFNTMLKGQFAIAPFWLKALPLASEGGVGRTLADAEADTRSR